MTLIIFRMAVCLIPALLVFSSCAHYPVNQRVEHYDTIGYLAPTAEETSDELLMVLAFSGGGTRAAALSYGVLEALAQVEIPAPGGEGDASTRHSLLHEVDAISSVSGGSFTAASYGLCGDQIFLDYEERFLRRNVNMGLLIRALSPINMFRLFSPSFSRSDLAAEYYDSILFRGATFSDLRAGHSPAVLIQATDIVDGVYFGFTPVYFSLICSDLDSYSLARAVAASAAYPGPLTAITLRNYGGTCGLTPPPWMVEALEERHTLSRTFVAASHFQTYLDSEKKPYVHLLDGGLSDNLALRGPLEVILGRGGLQETLRKLGRENIRRVVFIIVDAEKQLQTPFGLSQVGPGLLGIIGVTSNTMISSYNFETIELLHRYITQWSAESAAQVVGHPIEFYAIDIAFAALPDEEERDYFSSIPTSFNLSDEQVDRLIKVAAKLLYSSEEFQKLVTDLGGTIPLESEPTQQ